MEDLAPLAAVAAAAVAGGAAVVGVGVVFDSLRKPNPEKLEILRQKILEKLDGINYTIGSIESGPHAKAMSATLEDLRLERSKLIQQFERHFGEPYEG